MTEAPNNGLVANYNDAILYQSDLELLRNPHSWLNDACIHFYLEHLQQSSTDKLFIDPSVVTFLMHQCDEEDLVDFSESFDKKKNMYVVPINDGHISAAWKIPGGGTHWSLLVLYGTDACHFDSVHGSNLSAAKAVAHKFGMILERDLRVREAESPQQENPFDCGVYALAAAESVVEAPTLDIAITIFCRKVRESATFSHRFRRNLLELALMISCS